MIARQPLHRGGNHCKISFPGGAVKQPICILFFNLIFLFLLSACGLNNGILPSPTTVATTSPTDTPIKLPDLVVLEVSLEGKLQLEDICAGDPRSYRTRVQIENRGSLDAGPFLVEVNQIQQTVADGLEIGGQITLWFSTYDPNTRISVDVADQVVESNENNNQSDYKLLAPTQPIKCEQTPTPEIAYAHPVAVLEGHTGAVLDVAFSPDGNLVASGSVDNTMRLWLVNSGQLLRTMREHPFPVRTLAFSPDGVILATGSTDGLIRLWYVSNAQLNNTLEGHAGWIVDLDISQDGKFLVSAAEDFTVRVWRLSNGKLVQTIDEGMAAISSATFSPNGNEMAWGEADGTVRLRSLGGKWLHTLKDGSHAATSVAYSPDGGLLAAGYADGAIRLWRTDSGELLQTLSNHLGAVSSLAFAPDGEWLVSGSLDNNLRLWQMKDGEILTTPQLILVGHANAVNSVAFSPRGTLIASGSDDGTILLWAVPAK